MSRKPKNREPRYPIRKPLTMTAREAEEFTAAMRELGFARFTAFARFCMANAVRALHTGRSALHAPDWPGGVTLH